MTAEPIMEPGLEPTTDQLFRPPAEPFVWTPTAPVLAPYLGLVSAVLCALGGGWLLLAPFALDYRHGAPSTPHSTEIDLVTGAMVVAVAIVGAVLFSLTLARRLRTPAEPEPVLAPDAVVGADAAADVSEPGVVLEEATPEPEPEPAPVPEPSRPEPFPDPNSSLRELLTPLVAALAADLKSRTDNSQGGTSP